MGRPPKDPGERQRNRVTVLLTDDEYNQVREAAQGRPPGSVLRDVVLRWLKGRRRR
jgi:hypothetical protein